MNAYIQRTTVLERLVDWREAIHRHGHEHFDMDSWGYSPEGIITDPDAPDDGLVDHDLGLADLLALDINSCGTTACAAGHFVCHARLMESECDHTGIEVYVAECLGVSTHLFNRYHWCSLLLDDETLRDRFDTYRAEHDDLALCEWMAVLDYIDHRIKREMEATS